MTEIEYLRREIDRLAGRVAELERAKVMPPAGVQTGPKGCVCPASLAAGCASAWCPRRASGIVSVPYVAPPTAPPTVCSSAAPGGRIVFG